MSLQILVFYGEVGSRLTCYRPGPAWAMVAAARLRVFGNITLAGIERTVAFLGCMSGTAVSPSTPPRYWLPFFTFPLPC